MLTSLRSFSVRFVAALWLVAGCLATADDASSSSEELGGCGGVQLRNYNSNELDFQKSGASNDATASFLDGTTRVVFSRRLDQLSPGEVLAITSDFAVTDRYDVPGPYSYDFVDHGGPQLVGVVSQIVLASSPTATSGVSISGGVAKEISYNQHHGEITKGAIYTVSSGDADGAPRYVNVVAWALCGNNGIVPCSPAEGATDYYARVDSLGALEVRRFTGIGATGGNQTAGAASAPLGGAINLPIQPMSACDSITPPYRVISSVALGDVSAGEVVEGFAEAGLQLNSTHRARILGKIIVAPSPTSAAGFDVSAETFTQLPPALTYGTFFKTGSRAAPHAQAGAYLNAVLVACEDSPDGNVYVQPGTAHVQGLYAIPAATPASIAPSGPIGTNAFGPGSVVTGPSSAWGFYGDGSIIPQAPAANSHAGWAAGLWANGLVSTTVYSSGTYDTLNVSAAGEYCADNLPYGYGWQDSTEGAPAFNVYVDGAYVGSRMITEQGEFTQTYDAASGTWFAQTQFSDHLFPVAIGPGAHTVAIQYFNDYRGRNHDPTSYLCDRNLLVDLVGFVSRQAPPATVIGIAQQETGVLATGWLPLDGNWHEIYALDLGPLTSANVGEVIAVSAEYQVGAGTTTTWAGWTGGNIPEVAEGLQIGRSPTMTDSSALDLDGSLGDNIDLVSFEQGRTRVATHTITADDVSHARRYVKLRAYAQSDGSLPNGYIVVGGGKLAVLRYPKAGASAN